MPSAPCDLMVKGHSVHVPRQRSAPRVSISPISARSRLARRDYLRIAHEFHTLLIDRMPVMNYEQRNEAKRFIILIDTLYDNAVKLVASADAEPDELYQAEQGYEANEFKRTASRLYRDAFAVLSRLAARPARRCHARGHRRNLNAIT